MKRLILLDTSTTLQNKYEQRKWNIPLIFASQTFSIDLKILQEIVYFSTNRTSSMTTFQRQGMDDF